MPARKKVTKDFVKLIFAGDKELIPQSQIRAISVPRYDELSVHALIKDVMANKDLAKFFPEQRTSSDLPDREYFFNVLNTVEPDYLGALIKHAQNQRFDNKLPDENPNIIEVTSFWKKELEASPYFSSKSIFLIHHRITGQDLDVIEKDIKARTKGV
jgi:hypothetical protein